MSNHINTHIHDQWAIEQFNDKDFTSIDKLPMDNHIFSTFLQEYRIELNYCLRNSYIEEAQEQRNKIYDLIKEYRFELNKSVYRLELVA